MNLFFIPLLLVMLVTAVVGAVTDTNLTVIALVVIWTLARSAMWLITHLRGAMEAWRHRSLTVAKQLTFPTLSGNKLLLIRTDGDEASAWLLTVQAWNWLMTKGWLLLSGFTNWVDAMSGWIARLAAKCGFAWLYSSKKLSDGTFANMFGSWFRDTSRFALVALVLSLAPLLLLAVVPSHVTPYISFVAMMPLVIYLMTVLLPVLLLIFNILLGFVGFFVITFLVLVTTMAFGIRLGLASPFLELSAEPVPPGVWRITQLVGTASSANQVFGAHASYDHPEALEAIIAWLMASTVVDRHLDRF